MQFDVKLVNGRRKVFIKNTVVGTEEEGRQALEKASKVILNSKGSGKYEKQN